MTNNKISRIEEALDKRIGKGGEIEALAISIGMHENKIERKDNQGNVSTTSFFTFKKVEK